jgi:ATP-dependent DNA helicase RecG
MDDQGWTPDASNLEAPAAFLPEATSLGRLAETLVALANAEGGMLLIGVDARTEAPQGLSDAERMLQRTLQAALAVEPSLIIPLPQVREYRGEAVLSVTVPPGLPHVFSYKGKYLVRSGGRNRPLQPYQLRLLMMERGAVSFEKLVPEGASADDMDWEAVEQYLSDLEGFSPPSREQALLQRGGLVEVNNQLCPTYAGLLLFGLNPQRWVPSSKILVTRYAGTEMDDRFIKEEIGGTLPQQIRRAEAFVRSNMQRRARLAGLERIEETEYPVDVVREAIVNAVAHRDYQIRGDEIRILLFRDRLVFYSPGRLPGHVTIENLVHERFSRNEVTVQVLSDLGFIERLGYGIDRMMRQMIEAGLPAPDFKETAAGFQVTLLGAAGGFVEERSDPRQWQHLGLNERQQAALGYMAESGRITNREYQELCPEVSPETLRRDLADLVRKNLLLKIGDKRGTYYIQK